MKYNISVKFIGGVPHNVSKYDRIVTLIERGEKVKITEYKIKCENIREKYRFAVISDLHGTDPSLSLELLRKESPDFILAPGDVFERVDGSSKKFNKMNEKGFLLLSEAAKIAPTFYSCGNHEIGGTRSWAFGLKLKRPSRAEWSEENKEKLCKSGVVFLDDSYVFSNGIAFGGLSSGILNDGGKPDVSFVDEFSLAACPKILLCHHPEYYEKYLYDKNIDLIVSGHAHGGQWSFFGRGVFAPGQGLFPKYTAGVYDERLVVSRGMKKGGIIPRIFNPTEVLIVSLN